jgi:hypothetical protein
MDLLPLSSSSILSEHRLEHESLCMWVPSASERKESSTKSVSRGKIHLPQNNFPDSG